MIGKEAIAAAHERIKPYIKRTPVLTSSYLDSLTGAMLYFKCENLQEIGAFKMRGAMNALLSLPARERACGVATHSSGNHAQAVARAAALLGVTAHVVMPTSAPAIKRKGVESFGAKVYDCPPTLAGREETLKEVLERTGAVEIHPFNNDDVITGQATAGKELFEDVNDLDIVITPVGGGGLISGTCLAANYFSPGAQVLGGEPAGADDAFRSLQSGRIEVSQANSIADGLLSNLGEKTFTIMKQLVKRIITVEDREIVQAMTLLLERLKVLVEPSGAVPMAAILRQPEFFRGKSVGVIISGGNVDMARLTDLSKQFGTNK